MKYVPMIWLQMKMKDIKIETYFTYILDNDIYLYFGFGFYKKANKNKLSYEQIFDINKIAEEEKQPVIICWTTEDRHKKMAGYFELEKTLG